MTVDDQRPPSDEGRPVTDEDPVGEVTTAAVVQAAQELSRGLHDLAIEAGRLEQLIVGHSRDELDHDTQLALDQAHSNAAAIESTLARLGLG